VQEYYILDPTGEHMHFFQLTPDRQYEEIQPDAERVIRSQLLPGFQFRHSDLYELRALEELALDEVYQGFVLPKYQESLAAVAAETTARQQAEHRADTEATARQQAEQRAESEATARRQAEQRIDAETAARRQAEERLQSLEAELARLRRRSS